MVNEMLNLVRAGIFGFSLALLMTLGTVGVMAQTPATRPASGAGRPGQFGSPPVRSPEVGADSTVTFRLMAPNAMAVAVRGITQQSLAMQKDDMGVWSATTAALKPDLYTYSFDVDGLSILDPSNTRFSSAYRRMGQNLVLVPGDMPWTPLPNVPRGVVSRHVFQSRIADDERDFIVYTPPNYDSKRREPYPVLYLHHGWLQDTNAWVDDGAANVTLDTLINQGKAVPMIVVMPHAYGTAAGPADIDHEDMLPMYTRILLEELMPQVEKQYNVSTAPAGRAMAGLSMGGAESMHTGLNHLETFAWLGSFSGAFNTWPLTRPSRDATAGGGPRFSLAEDRIPSQFPQLAEDSNAQIKLLWIACGTADFGALPTNRQFKKYLDSIGIKVTYTETPDIGHTWPFWRRNLADFVQLLFR
jgi:enterochelin esterase-like enzyme